MRKKQVSDLTTKELHDFVRCYNWDEGEEAMVEAARSTKCDLGTALLIYWLAAPEYYFSQYATRSKVPSDERTQWDFLIEIEKRVAEGFYKTKKYLFDPTNFEGQDITDITDRTRLKRKVPAEMFGPLYSGPPKEVAKPTIEQVKRMNHDELDAFVSNHSWFEGIGHLEAAVRNPNCDCGTALAVYWRCGPHYFDGYASMEDVPVEDLPLYRLMVHTEKAILSNRFKHATIPYNPRNDNGTDWTRDHYHHKKARRIPEQLFRSALATDSRTRQRG